MKQPKRKKTKATTTVAPPSQKLYLKKQKTKIKNPQIETTVPHHCSKNNIWEGISVYLRKDQTRGTLCVSTEI